MTDEAVRPHPAPKLTPMAPATQREQVAASLRLIRARYGSAAPWESWSVFGPHAQDVFGRHETAARMRSDAAIRLFHRRPSWRLLWAAVRWAFLSGVRRDGVYVVSFDAGEEIADVARIDNIGR